MKTRKFNFEVNEPDPLCRAVRRAQLKARRADKARADLARWEKRLRRAKKEVRRLKVRVKYYEEICTPALIAL